MNGTLNQKIVLLTPPGAIVDAAGFTTASLDTIGWNDVSFYAVLGATDIAMDALKVQHSDTDGSYADVTGADFGGLPSADEDNKVVAAHISKKGGAYKRFYDVVATAGNGSTGTYCTIFAILSNPDTAPDSAADRGLFDESIL